MATFKSLFFLFSLHTISSFYVSINRASKNSILIHKILRLSTPDDVPRTGTGGEWSDWDNDSYMEDDPYTSGDDKETSKTVPTISKDLLKAGTSEVVSNLIGSINDNMSGSKEEEISKKSGGGEWSDWDNDSFMEDEYVYDPDDTPSFPSMELLQAGSGTVTNLLGNINENIDKLSADEEKPEEPKELYVRNEKDWVGWSEDPPYFDDDDLKETKDFLYGGEKGKKSETTDLFAKPDIMNWGNPAQEPVPTTSNPNTGANSVPEVPVPTVIPSIPSAGDSATNFLLLIEINRRFDRLEEQINSLSVNKAPAVEYALFTVLGFLFALLLKD